MTNWGNLALADDVRRDTCALFKPPIDLSVSGSAVKYVRIRSASGGSIPYDADLAPYMKKPMDLLSSRRHEAVIFAAPARTSKTQSLVDCWVSHVALCDPGDMLLYFPTETNAADFSRRRLKRLHEDVLELSKLLSPHGHDNTIRRMVYRNGMLLNLGWPTSSQMAQRDARYVGLSDYDSMPDDINSEGTPFDLAKKRIQAMLSAGMAMAESSPKKPIIVSNWQPSTPHEAPPVSSGILALYNRGDRHRWYWQCIHCGYWFEAPALPEYIEKDDINRTGETARVVCPDCGGLHHKEHKRALQIGGSNNLPGTWVPDNCTINIDGEIEGEAPASPYASFWLKGCAAAFQSWSSLVTAYLRAVKEFNNTGEEDALKTTTNVDQGMPYLPKSMINKRSSEQLQNRLEQWDRGTIPVGVRFITATTDVQGSMFVNHIHGWGYDNERWLIDRFMITRSNRKDIDGNYYPLDPATYQEDWALLETEVLNRQYTINDKKMSIRIHVCDSGGKAGVTEKAYDHYRVMTRKGYKHRFALVKGDGNLKDGLPLLREVFPTSKRKDRNAGARGDVPVYLLNVNVLKDTLNNDLNLNRPGRGFIHFPEFLEQEFFQELEAEIRTHKGWVKQSKRNEAWDAMIYDRGAMLILEYLMKKRLDWDNPPAWAREADNNTFVFAAKQDISQMQPARKKRRVRSRGV